ncbi:MAG: RNA polymerase sigma factor [Actinomycetota bacterium]
MTTTTTPPGTTLHRVADETRFREQVLSELDVLYRVARRLARDPNDAEDLVQETLLRAYRAFDRFDGRHPRAWLLTILRNRFYSETKRARPDLLDDEVSQRLPAHGADGRGEGTEEAALAGDLDPVVRAALASLSAKHRAVIALVDLDGLTYQEAADLLEVPAGTVMSRLHRARGKVRARLAAHGIEGVAR